MPIARRLAAAAATLLISSTLSVVATSLTPASAACAPSTVVAPQATAKKMVKVSRQTTVRKTGRRFVATVRVTATQGAATVTLTQAICPDGADGAAASTTQSAGGVGTVTRTVSAKGTSKTDARRSARAKASRAITRIRKAAATKKGVAAAKRRATAVARKAAAEKAHHALHDSSVYWIHLGPEGKVVVHTTRPQGALNLSSGGNGDIVLTASTAFNPLNEETPLPCLRRAPVWPSAFLASATAVASPTLRAAADAADDRLQVLMTPVDYAAGDRGGPEHFGTFWTYDFDGSSGSAVTERSSFDSSSGEGVATFAGDGLCFTFNKSIAAGTTVTFAGLMVATAFEETATSARVTGGVPVSMR